MRAGRKRIVGVDYDEGPPVPIPNTEVKLVRAENTWLVTAREDRCSPTQKALSKDSAFFRVQGSGLRLCEEKRKLGNPRCPAAFFVIILRDFP